METKTFAELNLSAKVQQAIAAAGYTTPTPIQAAAIPVAVAGRDVLGIAQTGTGKTASFTLPMISRLETGRARARMPRSLILAPTRELAAQVAQSFEKYGINHKLDVALLIGGVSMDEQSKKLDRGVDVLIATPGRLLDHFQRGRIMLMGVEILVIDEADRMLDMGFIPDIEKICKMLPPRRQTLFFSATMPPEITRLTQQFLTDPVRIEAAPPATMTKTITQQFCYCPDGEDWTKREQLRTLLRGEGVRNAIIFCNRKVEVAVLLKSLLKHGFNAGALHGDMDQKSRTETLDKFRSGEIAFLAASDVAARGLDIPDVSHVFNFDLPRDKDDYVHRIGRTGRAGKEGHSTSLVTPFDLKQLQEIEKMTGEPVVWTGEAPSAQDFEDAGKKRRGRPGAAPGGGRGALRGGRERPLPGRGGERGGERSRHAGPPSPRRDAPAAGGRDVGSDPSTGAEREPALASGREGQPRSGSRGAGHGPGRGGPPRGPDRRRERSRDEERPARREMLNTGQRQAQRDGMMPPPGLEPQPVLAAVAPVVSVPQDRAPARDQPPRERSGRPMQRVRTREGQGEQLGGRASAEPVRGGGDQRSAKPHRDGQPAREPRPNQGRNPDARNQDSGARSSFADNVPAFLQKPVRPVKAASE